MDPQAMWDQLLDAYAAGNWDKIEAHATALLDWLQRGGMPPQIVGRSELGPDWDRTLARAGCRFVLELLGERWNTFDANAAEHLVVGGET